MPALIPILSKERREYHDTPPLFNAAQRKAAFYIKSEIKSVLEDSVRGLKNRAYFLLAYGYFKETAQFYEVANIRDIRYVCSQLGLSTPITLKDYGKQARRNHRQLILNFFNISPFEYAGKDIVLSVARKSYKSRLSPTRCFKNIIDKLKERRCEIPAYQDIAKLISFEYDRYRTELKNTLSDSLTEDAKNCLDALIEKKTLRSQTESVYALTLAKRFSHSTKPSKVKNNLKQHDVLSEAYTKIEPAFKKLDLNIEGIKSFASVSEYKQVFSLRHKKLDERNLYLVLFIANQLFRLEDILGKIVQSVLKTSFNDADRTAKDKYYKNRNERDENISTLLEEASSASEQLEKIENILVSTNLSAAEKVKNALQILKRTGRKASELNESISEKVKNTSIISGTELFLEELRRKATNIDNRCKGIILRLSFDFESSDKKLGSAIKKFRATDGKIDKSFPLLIIDKKYRKYVRTKDGKFDTDLYKVLFYNEIAEALKSERLSLSNSYEFASLDRLLLNRSTFLNNIKKFLKEAGMTHYKARLIKKHWT